MLPPTEAAPQLTVTVVTIATTAGMDPAGIDAAAAEPEPPPVALHAPAAAGAIRSEQDGGYALVAVTLTGIERNAPWHELTELVDMETAPASENTVVAPAASASERPVWVENATPWPASQAAPASLVIVPLALTAVICTGNAFGFVTFTLSAPLPPGQRSPVVEALASLSVIALAVAALADAVPLPFVDQAAIPTPTPASTVTSPAARASRAFERRSFRLLLPVVGAR